MVKKSENTNLHNARKAKNDEFYTKLSDIEKELVNYRPFLKDKIVLCNCDDPEWSNFTKHFTNLFLVYGLKKLICTHYDKNGESYKIEYYLDENNNIKPKITPLEGDGDFRSDECIELLKQADVVVTNPPFSLFIEYVNQLIKYDKKFLIIGNKNAITYKDIFKLIKENKIWLGYTIPSNFYINLDGDLGNIQGLTRWFTNFDIEKRHETLDLYKKYNENDYPKYDNYDCIEVGKVRDIPCDYYGLMGVPITFLDKYNPEQFEIISDSRYHDGKDEADDINIVNGKQLYRRILIKKNQGFNDEFEW